MNVDGNVSEKRRTTLPLVGLAMILFALGFVGCPPTEAPTAPTTVTASNGDGALTWEHYRGAYANSLPTIYRTPVPGGWLVSGEKSLVFIPDEHHTWLLPTPEKEKKQ